MRYLTIVILLLLTACSDINFECIDSRTISRQTAISKYGDWIVKVKSLSDHKSFVEKKVIMHHLGFSGVCVSLYSTDNDFSSTDSVYTSPTLTIDNRGYMFIISHDDYRSRRDHSLTDTLWTIGWQEKVCQKGMTLFVK